MTWCKVSNLVQLFASLVGLASAIRMWTRNRRP